MTVQAQPTAEDQAALDAAAKVIEDQKVEAEALKDFNAGFEDKPAEPVETKAPTAEELKAEEDAKAETERLAAEEEAKKKAADAPPLAQITEPQFLDLVKKANSVDEIRALAEKVRDTTNGRVGSLEQMIKQLQAATPTGQAITVSPEDFAEINKDLPDHAKMLADGLTRVLSKFKGTAAPVATETPEQFEARVNEAADKRIADREAARLKVQETEARADIASVHPDWETVVGTKEQGSEWRTWLKSQPPLYEKKMLTTMDPELLATSLTKFKEEKVEKAKKPPVTPSSREQRLREAVPVRGGASALNTKHEKTAEEHFAEGFSS